MKVKAKIMGIDISLKGEDTLELQLVGIGKQHVGGSEREVSMVLRVEAARALVKDFALGDVFEITLDHVAADRNGITLEDQRRQLVEHAAVAVAEP